MNKFSADIMQQIDSDLDELLAQDPPIKSNEELIGRYAIKMRAALEKGWPLEAIVDILKRQGIEIQPTTLRSYIQRQKKKVEQAAVFADAQTADTPAAAAATKKPRKRKKKDNNNQPNQPLVKLLPDPTPTGSSSTGSSSSSFTLDSDEV